MYLMLRDIRQLIEIPEGKRAIARTRRTTRHSF